MNMLESSVPVFIPDLRQAVQIPEKGIVSRILQNDEKVKVILYGLASGHAMSPHVPSHLKHVIVAHTPVIMLLTILK
jgi:hypothetical protein